MNKIEQNYLNLLKDVLDNGVEKDDRTGTGNYSVFGRQLRHNLKYGFPLFTTRKLSFKNIITELLWFLKGRTDLKYLLDNKCHIWVGDAYKRYINENQYTSDPTWLKKVPLDNGFYGAEMYTKDEFVQMVLHDEQFSKIWGDCGKIYGFQWRSWKDTDEFDDNGIKIGESYIDQILNLIRELKSNPDSRRLMVSAWAVHDLPKMLLPPCHHSFQMYTRELTESERYYHLLASGYDGDEQNTSNMMKICDEKNIPTRAISLMWNQRSVDLPLGFPYNIASYSLLLMMIAKEVNMIPEEVIANLGDVHVYKNQVDGIKELLQRNVGELPTVKISDRKVKDINEYTHEDIILENYNPEEVINIPLSN
jgi:thymidylate synthase